LPLVLVTPQSTHSITPQSISYLKVCQSCKLEEEVLLISLFLPPTPDVILYY
jgi:hypothetical protein